MNLPPFETGYRSLSDGGAAPYVTIGSGSSVMMVIPGAADGLRTCVEVAVYLAWFYRERARISRIVILSRRDPIPERFSVEQHASDMIETMDTLGIGPAIWECLSAAGVIGQQIALQRPDLVRGLILSSAFDHVCDRTRRVLNQWLRLAQHPTGFEEFSGMFEQKYRPPPEALKELSAEQLATERWHRSPDRLMRILEPLLEVDQRSILSRIACPTLVIGGEEDRTVPAQVQREMAARIADCEVALFPGFGHFNDMENPAYEAHLQAFVQRVNSGTPPQ